MPRTFPYQLTVAHSVAITPNMQRVRLQGEDLTDFPLEHEGGYVKLVFPAAGETVLPTVEAVEDGADVLLRTYTVRNFDPANLTIDIDFVLHGLGSGHGNTEHGGPASTWARNAKAGDAMLMYGPGKVQHVDPQADWFLFAGDMTALPAISCHLEHLDEKAKGFAVLEINSEQDRQSLDAPAGIEIIWVVNPHSDKTNFCLSDAVKAVPWQTGKPAIWAACEFSNMRRLRTYFKQERNVARDELYVSSYWKIGQTEDKHKISKRRDAEKEAMASLVS